MYDTTTPTAGALKSFFVALALVMATAACDGPVGPPAPSARTAHKGHRVLPVKTARTEIVGHAAPPARTTSCGCSLRP